MKRYDEMTEIEKLERYGIDPWKRFCAIWRVIGWWAANQHLEFN